MLASSVLPLVSDTTRLRRMTDADAAAYAAGTADDAVRRFGHLPEPEYTPESVRTMIREVVEPSLADGTLAVLALADAESDEFVGSMVIFDIGTESAEVSFWIAPEQRGAGHATRGLDLAATLAQDSGLSALTARTATANSASQQCLINAGFVETSRQADTTPADVREEVIHYRRRLYPDPHWPLSTDRLRLRLHQPQDHAWLEALYSRPEVARYLLDDPWTAEDTDTNLTQRLERTGLGSTSGALALVIEHDRLPVGDVALWLTDRVHGQAEIGWVLDPDHGGQGFASEAVQAVLKVGFQNYQLHRITAQMDARNAPSAALAQRVGMRLEAHHVEDWYSKGQWTSTLVYACLASEHVTPPPATV